MLKDLQKLPEKKRTFIFWTIVSILGIIFLIIFILITANKFGFKII